MAKQSKVNITLSMVMASLVMGSLVFSSYAYWSKNKAELNIPTTEFNATEEEFTFFACIPNISSTTGYDYYDLDQVPSELVDDIKGLAVVRYEALTRTAFIPDYPKVTINGEEYNENNLEELPVIHVLNSLSSDDVTINNGFTKVINLIIPKTITYIEPGSFNGATALNEISILGDEYSGNVTFSETNFTRVDGLGNLRYQHESRKTSYRIESANSYSEFKLMQFNNGELQYENKGNVFSTYVIPNETITSITINGKQFSCDMLPNVKYKIDYSHVTGDIRVVKYQYKLSINGNETPLVLNNNVNYEEYVLNTNFGIINIPTYEDIYVNEYENDILNESCSFRLRYLDAEYSKGNNNFEIKFAPSHVYESKHYYTSVGGDLIDVTTQTHIGVEKAYFLNNVINSNESVNNQELQTITVPNPGYEYISLYMVAKNSKGESYIDPNTESEYIQLSLNDAKSAFTYTFMKTASPSSSLPTSYVFYEGKYNIISLPNYIASANSDSEIQHGLDYINGEKVYYLDLSSAGLSKDDHVKNGETNPDYKWYLAYWPSSGVMTTKPLEFINDKSDIIRFTIPNGTTKFKFVRINYEDDINNALKGNWEDVVNQNHTDVLVADYLDNRNNNYMAFAGWENSTEKFYLSYASINLANNTRRIYLDTDGAGFTGEHWTKSKPENTTYDIPPQYRWYLVYWKKVNGVEKQFTMPIYYIDNNATSLAVNLPLDAEKFKFARIPYNSNIDTALSNSWGGVTNQNNNDITLASLGSNNVIYWTNWDVWNDKMFTYGFKEASMDASVVPMKHNYLKFENYGADGNTSYLVLDENMGYGQKNATNLTEDYQYEYTKLEDLNSGIIQKVSLTKGSLISASILNPFKNTYDAISFSASNVECDNSHKIEDYFEYSNSKIVVKQDCQLRFYLKVNYDKTSKSIKNPTIYIDISTGLANDLVRNIVRVENSGFTLTAQEYTLKNEILSGTYPLLTTQSSVMLQRNHANKDFEEYYVYDPNGFTGSYIVSQYSDNRKFGYGQMNPFFGVYRDDSPLGEYEIVNQNNVKFTPNESSGYKTSYVGAFDEFGNLLAILDYSKNQSLALGYNVYLGNIPVAGKDYSYVDVKELGSQHEIDNNMKTIYVDFGPTEISEDDYPGTDGKQLFQWYLIYWDNETGDRTIEPIYYIKDQGEVIKFDVPNDVNRFKVVRIPSESNNTIPLVKDNQGNIDWDGYYLSDYWNNIENQIERDIYPSEVSNYNCIRFKKWIEGDQGGRFQFELSNYNTTTLKNLVDEFDATDSSTLQYQFYFQMVNNNNGFIKESVDGSNIYYSYDKAFIVSTSTYKIFNSSETAINFSNKSAPLDFSLIDGYNYTGLEFDGDRAITFPDGGDGYYDLRIYYTNSKYYLGYRYYGTSLTLRDNEFTLNLIEDNKEVLSTLMNQTNNVNNYFIDINVSSGNNEVHIINTDGAQIANFTISEPGYYRVYVSDKENLSWTNNHYSYQAISYIPISYDLVNNQVSIFGSRILLDKARPFIDSMISENISQYMINGSNVTSVTLDKNGTIYSQFVRVNTIDEVLTLYKDNEATSTTIKIPYPGKYLIEFDESTSKISATKVQKPSMLSVVLNGEVISDLVVEPDTTKYFEYTMEEYIVLQEPIYLESIDPETNPLSSLNVVDNEGSVVSRIDYITLDGERVTMVPAGAYLLTYSIDSSRRENSVYHVFTYMTLTTKDSASVKFNFTNIEQEEVSVTQIVGTRYGTKLYTYEELEGYVPGGKAFIGWATSKNGAVVYQDGEKVTHNIANLYPVFRDSIHETIFLSDLIFDSTTPIKFTLSDLNGFNIQSVKYVLDDGTKGNLYSRYIEIDEVNNIVTLKASICELIGYVEGGQEFVITLSDGKKEYSVSMFVPYPKFTSDIIVVPNLQIVKDDDIPDDKDVELDFATLFN